MSIFESIAPVSHRTHKVRVALLGASGSIGRQTIDVCRQHADKVELVSLAVYSSVELLVSLAKEFGVKRLAVGNAELKGHPALLELADDVRVDFGPEAVAALAMDDAAEIVLNALVGAAGLRASYDTLAAHKVLALANKESLVVGGDLIMPLAKPATLLPVDSEHSAIYQCYLGEHENEVHQIWLTASGGPFYGRTRDQLAKVTKAEALAHPNWSMGPKITIDSATLMNKGLETIEAHHLFGVDYSQITILVQRESCIHSMVEYKDGSVKAHLGATDMRIPIQFALSYPDRWETPCNRIDFRDFGHLTLGRVDTDTFRCLALALEAGKQGGTLPCVMNAANEIAVAAFLAERCAFTDIDRIVEKTMDAHTSEPVSSLEQLEAYDAWAREFASKLVE